jgi:hypothetical protein
MISQNRNKNDGKDATRGSQDKTGVWGRGIVRVA